VNLNAPVQYNLDENNLFLNSDKEEFDKALYVVEEDIHEEHDLRYGPKKLFGEDKSWERLDTD
jgi:hypothetical protein